MSENYFNYYTEIEQHFCRRRGTLLTVSTLDWALMMTWKDAGIPLEAVLRGIDEAFDKYDRRPSKTQKVNSLAYCSQAILTAAEEMKEAAVGTQPQKSSTNAGLEHEELARFLNGNAQKLRGAQAASAVMLVAEECAVTLTDLASTLNQGSKIPLEEL